VSASWETQQVLAPDPSRQAIRVEVAADALGELREIEAGREVEGGQLQLAEQAALATRLELQRSFERLALGSRIRLQVPRETPQAINEKVEVDLHPLATLLALSPGPCAPNEVDLLGSPERPVTEALDELGQAANRLLIGHRLLARDFPQVQDGERQLWVVSGMAAPIHPDLA